MTYMMRVYDAAPSASLPPNPPRAIAEDCLYAVIAVHDPSVREARALSAQVRELRERAEWLVATRRECGLPPARLRVVYCSRTPVRDSCSGRAAPTGGDASKAGTGAGRPLSVTAPGSSAVSLVPAGSVRVTDVPAPVRELASELRCPVSVIHLPTAQGLNSLARDIAASDEGLVGVLHGFCAKASAGAVPAGVKSQHVHAGVVIPVEAVGSEATPATTSA